jgi:hypothetical protein
MNSNQEKYDFWLSLIGRTHRCLNELIFGGILIESDRHLLKKSLEMIEIIESYPKIILDDVKKKGQW